MVSQWLVKLKLSDDTYYFAKDGKQVKEGKQ